MAHHEHQFGEGYSGRNPVPTVQGFRAENQAQHDAAAHDPATVAANNTQNDEPTILAATNPSAEGLDVNKPLPIPSARSDAQLPLQDQKYDPEASNKAPLLSDSPANDAPLSTGNKPTNTDDHAANEKKKEGGDPQSKAEIMDKMNANKNKPTDNLKKNQGERRVIDPVTKQEVIIKDAEYSSYDNDALDPSHPKPGPALNQPQQNGNHDVLHAAPKPAEPTNIFFQPYPPQVSTESLSPLLGALDRLGLVILAGFALVWPFAVWGKGWFSLIFRSVVIGGLAFGSYSMVGITKANIEKEIERIRADLHRVRGEKFSPPTPESVEWLNALLKTVWGLINPDMFQSVLDMVEDVMEASIPNFIDAVKISDMGQGTNPVRIVSMRGLPDQPGDKEYPREEWIDQGQPPALSPEEQEEKKKSDEGASLEDQSGDYVNYEISLSYQARPGQNGEKLRSSNIHLMLEFFLGLYDWLHIPVPIYTVVEGFAATARLRIQLVSEPPFVRNLTVTLMGVPKVEVSVEPLSKALPNVLDLPFIRGFVQTAIAAAANEYVAPKSLTLNLAQILLGDGVKKDTLAIGVLKVTIHHATGLSAQDRGGKSDPYVVLAYTKLGKPLYSSRIITEDLNPVWEETAFLLVTPDEIQAEEDLSVQLWDSDKRSADDLVGRVVVSLKELMKEPNKLIARTDKLSGFEDADAMPGEVHWSVGYFEKFPLNKALQVTAAEASKGDDDIPVEDKEHLEPTATIADTKEEADALTTPPDPDRRSGVLSVIIHQINRLERQDLKGATGDREGTAGQDTDDPSEQQGNLPSAYCEMLVNDEMVYKTRTKQYTSMPFFEAGTEKFIRDWTKTVVRVVVRDAKLREHDPILGIVDLPLEKVLSKASAVTGMYSLQEGVGFGRANISILFKSFKTDLPKTLSGWDTGTVHILSDVTVDLDGDHVRQFEGDKLSLHTSESSASVPGKLSKAQDSNTIAWTIDDAVRLPCYNRYQSAVHFEIGGGGLLNSDAEAVASLWLQDIPDDEETTIRIPLLKAKKISQVRQNYINEQTSKAHEFERIGWLSAKVMLDSGLDADHETALGTHEALRHNFETWEHIEGHAQQAEINAHAADDGVIDKDEKKAIDRAKKRELESRHRGKAQYAPYRTAKWMKDGVKSRAASLKDKLTGNKERAPTVETEA